MPSWDDARNLSVCSLRMLFEVGDSIHIYLCQAASSVLALRLEFSLLWSHIFPTGLKSMQGAGTEQQTVDAQVLSTPWSTVALGTELLLWRRSCYWECGHLGHKLIWQKTVFACWKLNRNWQVKKTTSVPWATFSSSVLEGGDATCMTRQGKSALLVYSCTLPGASSRTGL